MRMPTLLPFGEGSNERGKQSTRAPARSAGVAGTARRKGGSGNRGRPVTGEGSGLNVAFRRRPRAYRYGANWSWYCLQNLELERPERSANSALGGRTTGALG